ncbi:MADF domain,Myb-like domain [Cinara cedri]|uniref:MADF domain,Myb-like domain n=1 Tax=Cinara cedri TaxID=506608 RepID=A0A5E4N237_9HEMI|nr:MADF domain,Myb-like domain [Cinara cedri]
MSPPSTTVVIASVTEVVEADRKHYKQPTTSIDLQQCIWSEVIFYRKFRTSKIRINMSFTELEDISLVETIKSFEVLYKIGHEKYSDIAFKSIVWKGIAATLGKTVNQCKKRWRNIKASYIKNKLNLESTGKSSNYWPIHDYVTFLDGDYLNQKVNSSVSNKGTKENELEEHRSNDNASHNDILALRTENNTPPSGSHIKNHAHAEDQTAIDLAKDIKEMNSLSDNNASFTIKIQNKDKATLNIKIDKEKGQFEDCNNVKVEDKYEQTTSQRPQPSTSDAVPSNVTMSSAQLKQLNEINKMYNLLKQFEMINEKIETVKSLDLFFKSVLADLDKFCPQAIDDVKLKILNCVSDVKGLYLNSDISSDSPASFSSIEENIILNNSMLNIKPETTKSTELFLKSVMVDMKDFCNVAMADAKIRILKCVSEVRDTVYPVNLSETSSNLNRNSNNLPMEARPNIQSTIVPTGQYRNGVQPPYNMMVLPIYCYHNLHPTRHYQ